MASIDGGNISPSLQNPYGRYGAQYTGSDNQAYAWQALYQMLGRAPTDAEVAQAAPSFQGADPNITNVAGGNQFVAQMVQQLNNQTPQGSQQTADTSANQLNQNVGANYQNLMPTLQSQYLDPLNQLINQQSGTQQGLANQTMGQQAGLTGQALGQNQQMTGQALGGQMGINQQGLNQQQGLENQYISGLQNTDQNQMQQLISQLGPSGQLGQQLMGEYNNYGLTPNSGGFQEGLSNTIGNLSMQEQQQIANALGQGYGNVAGAGQTGTNALSGILGQGLTNSQNIGNTGLNSLLGTSNQNYGTQSNLGIGGLSAAQSALQQPLTQGINQFNTQTGQSNALQNLLVNQGFNQNTFNQESTLGQLLAQMSQPSGVQQDIGLAGSAGNALTGAAVGTAGASKLTSYVCMELIKRGLICEMDMDDFHVHIMPALFKKGRAFWKYAMDGYNLVQAVNAKGLDWKVFKPLLFDRVMEEPDACKAVDLYADACHQLCISCDRTLWDERVYRSSWWDSLPFIPLLLMYTPFLKALWKCFRIKTLLLYDRPRCEHGIR